MDISAKYDSDISWEPVSKLCKGRRKGEREESRERRKGGMMREKREGGRNLFDPQGNVGSANLATQVVLKEF